jgi:DNA-binding transcriptional ArsR family regulator
VPDAVPVNPDLLAALKALSNPERIRILGRVAGQPATPEDLARELVLPLAAVVRHVGVLRSVELLRADDDVRGAALKIRLDTLQRIGRELDELEHGADRSALPGLDGEMLAAEDAKVLRSYIEDGRLTSIPSQEKKRLVVLRWLRERVFTEDREYPEKEVNQRLAVFHPDVASLRRYMVDARLASRSAGLYRRSDEGA